MLYLLARLRDDPKGCLAPFLGALAVLVTGTIFFGSGAGTPDPSATPTAGEPELAPMVIASPTEDVTLGMPSPEPSDSPSGSTSPSPGASSTPAPQVSRTPAPSSSPSPLPKPVPAPKPSASPSPTAKPTPNRAPQAKDDQVATARDTAIVIKVLDNDTDLDGDKLTITSLGSTQSGVKPTTNGTTITYTPKPGWAGQDSFAYTISDGENSSTAQVRLVLTCNATASGARPTYDGASFTYEPSSGGEDPEFTNKLVVSFSEPVDISKMRGVTVVADGQTFTSVSAVWFPEDWMPGNGQTWTFTMDKMLKNGEALGDRTSLQLNTACNSVGDGNAAT